MKGAKSEKNVNYQGSGKRQWEKAVGKGSGRIQWEKVVKYTIQKSERALNINIVSLRPKPLNYTCSNPPPPYINRYVFEIH